MARNSIWLKRHHLQQREVWPGDHITPQVTSGMAALTSAEERAWIAVGTTKVTFEGGGESSGKRTLRGGGRTLEKYLHLPRAEARD